MNDPQAETEYLRAKIRDYLVTHLDEGALALNEASRLAQSALTLLPDGLSREQLAEAIKQLETKFPNHYSLIHSAKLEYELDDARNTVNQDVLSDIASGNLDSALDRVNKLDLK